MKNRNQTQKKNFSRKRRLFSHKLFAERDLVYTLICLAVIAAIVIIRLISTRDLDLKNLIELKTFVSVVLVFALNALTNSILAFIRSKREDKTKLISDYNELLKMYVDASPVKYRNSAKSDYAIGRKHSRCAHTESPENEDEYSIPLAQVVSFIGKNVTIRDSQDMYKLPPDIERAISDICQAHEASMTYNQLNIRCDKIAENGDEVSIDFSRTTYLYSLATNRALDFKRGGISVRDLYAYGPYLQPLEQSRLSNHIGFNGFVETSDGYVVLILRHKRVSIAKNTLQSSVGASLKTKYALDGNKQVTKDGIIKAIRAEIEDELGLKNIPNYHSRSNKIFADLTFKSVLCFYRELVEGGKPQFMFYTKINVTKDELTDAYQAGVKTIKRRNSGLLCRIDGYKMLLVHKNKLKNIYIAPDEMVVDRKAYKSVPSSTGTLALFIKYLDTGKIECE